MKISQNVKPGMWGAVIGAVAISIIGFGWGGWVTSGTAEKMASERGKTETVAALLPMCIGLSKSDPQSVSILKDLSEASSYRRRDVVIDAGWATMPGGADVNRELAGACAEALAANF